MPDATDTRAPDWICHNYYRLWVQPYRNKPYPFRHEHGSWHWYKRVKCCINHQQSRCTRDGFIVQLYDLHSGYHSIWRLLQTKGTISSRHSNRRDDNGDDLRNLLHFCDDGFRPEWCFRKNSSLPRNVPVVERLCASARTNCLHSDRIYKSGIYHSVLLLMELFRCIERR